MKKLILLIIVTLHIGISVRIAIAQEKTFKITTETFAPYIGKQLKNNGWTAEVARAALESQGYKVSLKFLPWARAVMESKKGENYDALYLSYYKKEREQWYVFSNPIGKVRTGFYKIIDADISYQTLYDLKTYKIGLTRGAAVSPEFDKADFLNKKFTTTDIQSLKKLLLGRIDLFAGSELVAKHLINTKIPQSQNKFEFVEPPLMVQELHMAVSKKTPNYKQKLKDFNRGLKLIRSNGTYNNILEKHGFKIQK